MLSTEVRAEIEISASPEAVWAVLADVETWSSWNRILLGMRLDGPLREGTRGGLSLRVGGRSLPPVPIRLVVVQPERELTWQGGARGLFMGRHGFRLTASETGTRVVHTEVFSGVLSLPLRLVHARMVRTYASVNKALRRRCEGDA